MGTTQQPISEDDDNYDLTVMGRTTRWAAESSNPDASGKTSSNTTTSQSAGNKCSSSFETNDSAIDVRSYSSISTLSRNSSSRRVNWHSFHKHYHNHFFQSVNTWSKYQISALSLEQIMALRKLALIQFSKLVERQHSKMIKFVLWDVGRL